MRVPTHIVSTICDDRGEEPTYHGVSMSELIEGDYGVVSRPAPAMPPARVSRPCQPLLPAHVSHIPSPCFPYPQPIPPAHAPSLSYQPILPADAPRPYSQPYS